MPSEKKGFTEAFVWVWLPGATEPVVAGRLSANGTRLEFNYGRSYLDRTNAISLYDAELPLRAGVLPSSRVFRCRDVFEMRRLMRGDGAC